MSKLEKWLTLRLWWLKRRLGLLAPSLDEALGSDIRMKLKGNEKVQKIMQSFKVSEMTRGIYTTRSNDCLSWVKELPDVNFIDSPENDKI